MSFLFRPGHAERFHGREDGCAVTASLEIFTAKTSCTFPSFIRDGDGVRARPPLWRPRIQKEVAFRREPAGVTLAGGVLVDRAVQRRQDSLKCSGFFYHLLFREQLVAGSRPRASFSAVVPSSASGVTSSSFLAASTFPVEGIGVSGPWGAAAPYWPARSWARRRPTPSRRRGSAARLRNSHELDVVAPERDEVGK